MRMVVCNTRNSCVAPRVQPFLKEHVVLLLNANTREFTQNVQMIGKVLKLDQIHLPRPIVVEQ